jgi:uncharacterized membrane protein YbaN (DUF454 family)
MSTPKPRPPNPFTRLLLAVLGLVCVALGTVGIVVPGLPTTPFLLAAAYLFAKSSPRLHDWLLAHRWFGAYVRAFRDDGALPLRAKVVTIAVLWISIGVSLAVLGQDGGPAPFAWVALISVGLGVSWLVGSSRKSPPASAPLAPEHD